MNNHYPLEMIGLVRELTEKRTPNKEIARICEERFGLPPLAKTAISSFKNRFGIKEAPLYSPEFLELIAKLRRKYDLPKTLEVLKHKHGVVLTRNQLKGICANHHIHCGRSGQFGAPGRKRPPAQKMRPETREKLQHTFFKCGRESWNTAPVGAERASGRGGYIWVKVSDYKNKPYRYNWRMKHHLIWEAAHGPIPAGHKVIFLDGDVGHFELSNLALVSAAEHMESVRRGLRFANAELTRTGVNIVRLSRALEGCRREGWKEYQGGKMNEAIDACMSRLLPYFRRGVTPEKVRPYLESLYKWDGAPGSSRLWTEIDSAMLFKADPLIKRILNELFTQGVHRGC